MSEILGFNPVTVSASLPPSPALAGAAKWFALYTAPRHEKRVAEHLDAKGVEHFLPLYSASRRWKNGQKVELDLPLFPGYLFVHISKSERTPVLEVPGALSFVTGTDRKPAPLDDAEIEMLRTGLTLRRAEPYRFLRIGERARIRSGALAGMEGVVVRVKGSLRIVLTMNLIMRSVSVEVDRDELESINSDPLFLPPETPL